MYGYGMWPMGIMMVGSSLSAVLVVGVVVWPFGNELDIEKRAARLAGLS